MKKESIKEIILNLVYDNDAKPRFVGGDISTKLSHIDNATDKIYSLLTNDIEFRNAKLLLSSDASHEEIKEMIVNIKQQAKVDGELLIDYVGAIPPIEAIEYKLTCNEFLDLIMV